MSTPDRRRPVKVSLDAKALVVTISGILGIVASVCVKKPTVLTGRE